MEEEWTVKERDRERDGEGETERVSEGVKRIQRGREMLKRKTERGGHVGETHSNKYI